MESDDNQFMTSSQDLAKDPGGSRGKYRPKPKDKPPMPKPPKRAGTRKTSRSRNLGSKAAESQKHIGGPKR